MGTKIEQFIHEIGPNREGNPYLKYLRDKMNSLRVIFRGII